MHRQFGRIFGDAEVEGSTRFMLLLPRVSKEDNLAILRTVFDGTPRQDSPSLATAYFAAHPAADTSPDDSDHVRDILEAYRPGQADLSPRASSWPDMVTHGGSRTSVRRNSRR